MNTLESTLPRDANYDAVGRYDQDSINGFSDETVERMLELADLASAESVLDAMGGDGNLTRRLGLYCQQQGFAMPKRHVLEFSRVQCEFARAELEGGGATVMWGDAVAMRDLANGSVVPDESFDRVLIKSALHELPLSQQLPLYQSIQRVLKPGGLFITMGFLFEDEGERDEFREIARAKDSLAGLHGMARDRHFLLRDEMHSRLRDAGFADIRDAHLLDYKIDSAIVAHAYFNKAGMDTADVEFQASQARCLKLRRAGRISFERDRTVMRLPGAITIARKPTAVEATQGAFDVYPYEFLRRLECHRELLDRVQVHIPEGARVADLGCGLGLLAERLVSRKVRYFGLDLNSGYVLRCRERLGDTPGFTFDPGDINTVELAPASHDVITLLNCVYLPGIEVLPLLEKCLKALAPGGVLIVSGPNGPDSFTKIEPKIRDQLQRDGLLPDHEETFQGICRANAQILTARGNYYSAEGMLALLRELGASPVSSGHATVYYDAAYLVAVTPDQD